MFMFCAYSKKYSLDSFGFFCDSPLSLVTGVTVPLVFFLFVDVDLPRVTPPATPFIPFVVSTGVTASATGPEAGVAKTGARLEEAGVVEDDVVAAAAAGVTSEDLGVAVVAVEDVDRDAAVVAAGVGDETAFAKDFFNSARAAVAAASPAATATASLPAVAAVSAAAFAAAASAASHAAAAARRSDGV